MILKTDKEIALMRKAGLLLWETHQQAKTLVREGISTKEIDFVVEDYILSNGAEPLFKGVPGVVPFPASACISVNDEIVHGIPSERTLVAGDIVSIDIGVKLNGWCADAAATWPVGEISADKQKLLDATENALRYAIKALAQKKRWTQISRKMQEQIESCGFSVVEDLLGHGIGRGLWEAPEIPNFYCTFIDDFKIEKGAVLAIEPMVNMGSKHVAQLNDHWTIVTRDKLPSAHFEHTVAVTKNGPIVLTCGPDGEGWAM
ncbi:MAG: type I methionyl aminopeptidase [Lentisphaerae bacterium]|nr:type I methionyl aminopeptidase [Lentisphaerota bacterium]MCP4103478.1 type I methionyl aminopeptidase [Lentisphaerota bacterium]